MLSYFKKFDLFWILISIICLGTAGLYSFAVSMMRSPVVYNFFHLPEFFKISLVIHVTLSINCWFMITGMYHLQHYVGKNFITTSLKYLIGLSVFLIIVSGFVPYSTPIIINYIPLIDNSFFLFGITLFFGAFLAITIVAFKKLFLKDIRFVFSNIEIQLLISVIFSIIIAYFCLSGSYLINRQYTISGTKINLEEFTWGIGHVLQFTFVEIGFLCLIKNLSQYNSFLKVDKLPRWFNVFFILKLIIVGAAPFFYFFSNYYNLFTLQMRHGIGIFLLPTTILIFSNIRFRNWRNWKHYSLVSLILMIIMSLYGGILGFSIKEINVVVPAHYHGSLLAIVIVIMSFTFGFLSDVSKKVNLDLMTVRFEKFIFIQLLTYGVGDAMHVTGLLIMGGYGALRKTPGDIPPEVLLGKFIFYIGSIVSVLSGVFFIILVGYAVKKVMKKCLTSLPN